MTLLYRAMKPLNRRLESAPGSLVASSARLRLGADAKYNPKTLRHYLAEHPDRVINNLGYE
jgi:hypothetical protein